MTTLYDDSHTEMREAFKHPERISIYKQHVITFNLPPAPYRQVEVQIDIPWPSSAPLTNLAVALHTSPQKLRAAGIRGEAGDMRLGEQPKNCYTHFRRGPADEEMELAMTLYSAINKITPEEVLHEFLHRLHLATRVSERLEIAIADGIAHLDPQLLEKFRREIPDPRMTTRF